MNEEKTNFGWNETIQKLDKIKLPKVNELKQKSKKKQTSLKILLLETIENFEKENDYVFEPYEVDNILLEMIKRNHEDYLNCKFGYDII